MQNKVLNEHTYEIEKGNNVAYVLKRNDMFYDIGFRVVKSQKVGNLLEPHRLKYNGNIKLVYFSDELMTFESIIRELGVESIVTGIKNLVNAIENVENNGFLNIMCIDNRLDKIFVDKNTMTIKLIYLPLNIPVTRTTIGEFKRELREQLLNVLKGSSFAENIQIKNILDELCNGNIQFNEIGKNINIVYNVNGRENNEKTYIFASIDGTVSMQITKNEFLVGKSAEKVNGVIDGNSAISRVHCKFLLSDGKLFIKDMNSANGTYANGKRISSEEYEAVEEGTRIRLANMDFIIRR